MTIEQILQLRNQGEATMAQFKERIIDKYDATCELVAMSNTKGGLLVVHLLPYTGAGSGIPRAMEPNPHVTFTSDDHRHEFIVTINLTEGQLVPAEEVKRLRELHQVKHQEMHQETNQEIDERPKETEEKALSNSEKVLSNSKKTLSSQDKMALSNSEEALSNSEMAPSNIDEKALSNQVGKRKARLEGKQKDIINFCSVPRTAQEIFDRIGVKKIYRAQQRYIQPLLDLGLIEMTIPENPRDRNQKYRKVAKKK